MNKQKSEQKVVVTQVGSAENYRFNGKLSTIGDKHVLSFAKQIKWKDQAGEEKTSIVVEQYVLDNVVLDDNSFLFKDEFAKKDGDTVKIKYIVDLVD